MAAISQLGARTQRAPGIGPVGITRNSDFKSYDVIHGHDWYSANALKTAKQIGLPTVFTSHLPLRGGFTYRDLGVEWKDKYRMEEDALKIADAIIAPSHFVKEYLIKEYGVSPQKLRVLPHGVDTDIFPSLQNPLPSEDRLLFVGRITQQKGLEILIRAFPKLIKLRPSVSLKIIGSGERHTAAANLVSSLGLSDRIHFSGPKNHLAIAPEYQSATALIMPSLFEPFGLVGLEALACGCPTFAISPTGADYLDRSEKTSVVSVERFAEALDVFLESLDRSVDAAILRSRRAYEYSPLAYAQRHFNLYEELIRCRPRR